MKVLLASLLALVVGALVGAGLAGVMVPDEQAVRDAAAAFVPDDAEDVQESVDRPPAWSVIDAVAVQVSYVTDGPPDIGQLATDAGFSFLAEGQFQRRGIEVAITGPVERFDGPVTTVFAQRSAAAVALRLGFGALLGALVATVGVLVATRIGRRRRT